MFTNKILKKSPRYFIKNPLTGKIADSKNERLYDNQILC